MTMIWPCGRSRAGFELAVAHDLFIHHFGSRTFAGNGIDARSCWRERPKVRGEVGDSPDRSEA